MCLDVWLDLCTDLCIEACMDVWLDLCTAMRIDM